MKNKRFLNILFSGLLAVTLIFGGNLKVEANEPSPVAQEEPPDPYGPYHVEGKVTEEDRQAAVANNLALGFKPGFADAEPGDRLAMDPNNPPHYFGPFANYANSPMPKGAVATLVVDSGGSGYTDAFPPVVSITDVYGTGTGALATATVVGGVVTAITINNGGASYSAPWVSIDDTTPGTAGTGQGASATATIGGIFDAGSGIRKFIDALPQLTPAGANELGNYIPIAVADINSFPDADYYEIAVIQYTQQMHTDLPATTLRGYIQLSTAANPGAHVALNNPDGSAILLPDGTQAYGFDSPHYLGPLIVTNEDRPVRIRFFNLLPIDAGGDLFIPADVTYMGAGMGALDQWGELCDPEMFPCESYSQNRATMHNHGAFVAWISDGTPHQWTTPANENTQYPKGVSVAYVPDMWYDVTGAVIPSCALQTTCAVAGARNNPGDGSMTFYYGNQQSARLMFYHDHSYGITRLNVYVGEVAGYIITDQIEQDLINGTNLSGANPGLVQALPDLGIPLIIQDKTFVDQTTIAGQDPTWRWGTGAIDPLTGWPTPKTGDLWVSSVYMPAQNPWDLSGASAYGRWMYGPWFWPPTQIAFGPVANPYYDPLCDPNVTWCEPPFQPGTPSPASGMEAFNDTAMVNGEAYPYLEVDPTVVRFRILNGANDRFFNLSLFVADPTVVTSDLRTNTEVKMVPALATPGYPADWPNDGREGGVPDPAAKGPDWVQIGTEGGFLPSPVVIPALPISYNNNPTNFNVGNVTTHSLLLGSAERADVLVDFSQYAGQTLIMYNDAPAAFPANAPYYDYYTGDPAQMDSGGAPTTQPGYGPNTRTVMQIRVRGNAAGSTVSTVTVTNGGSDYNAAPEVVFSGGGGIDAAASAFGSIDHISVLSPGLGYTTAPTVTIDAPSAPGGVQAVATAQLTNGRVTSLLISNRGSGYTSAPIITLTTVDTGSGATAVSALIVTEVQVTNPGSGYTYPPTVSLIGGGGYGASATAQLVALGAGYDWSILNALFTKGSVNANSTVNPGVFATGQDPIILPQAAYNSALGTSVPDTMAQYVQISDISRTFFNGPLTSLSLTNPGTGYTSAPLVVFSGGGATTPATANAAISGSTVNGLTLTARGTGYTSSPLVTLTGGGGTGATAIAITTRVVSTITVTNGGNNYTSPPTVSFSGGGGGGSGASAVAVVSAGSVTAVNVIWGGKGYSSAPTVNFSGGGGSGASATAIMTRVVNSLLITNNGTGYSSAPLVGFSGGGGTGAAATASILPGYVSKLTLIDGGAGYTSAPIVSFDNTGTNGTGAAAIANPITILFEPKAIHDEMGAAYDEYGRMSGLLGLELLGTNALVQNMFLYGYASPPVDIMKDSTMTPLGTLGDGTQIWQITHNGVDTHPIHFHLFNVQLINRVAWDGMLLPPEPNELGWKETVRVNPLEQTIVAMRPIAPTQPFEILNSTRLLDPTMPENAVLAVPPGGFKDPVGNPTTGVLNLKVNFGWEYVWHCHILSHEEMDMMHNLTFVVAPRAPSNVTLLLQGFGGGQSVVISWLDNSINETGFTIERSTTPVNGPWVKLVVAPPGPGKGSTLTFTDTTVSRRTTYYYRITADNLVGDTQVFAAPSIGFPTVTASSIPVNAIFGVTTRELPPFSPIFADSFETGFEEWSGQVGDLLAGTDAAIGPNGGDFGMVATVNGADPQAAYVYDDSPDAELAYDANFFFHPNQTISQDPIDIFVGFDQNFEPIFGVQFMSADGNTFYLRAWFLVNGEPMYTGWDTLTSGLDFLNTAHKVEVVWISGPNGSLSLYVDDLLFESFIGDTSAYILEDVILGPSMGMNSGTNGSLFFDEFTSSKFNADVPTIFNIYLPLIINYAE